MQVASLSITRCIPGILHVSLLYPWEVSLLPFYRRKPLTRVSHGSKTWTPHHRTQHQSLQTGGHQAVGLWETSVFHLQWLVLWNWGYICNYSRYSTFSFQFLRERERWFRSLTYAKWGSLCVKKTLRIRGRVLWDVGGQIKYRLPC